MPWKTSKAELKWVIGFAGAVMLVTTVPYILGFAIQSDQWTFSGFIFGVDDSNSYIAKMVSGSAGAWLFRTPYSIVPQKGIIAFLPYLLLGKLAKPPALHEQLIVIYHLFRIVAGILAILATYNFLSLFLRDIRWRRFGLVLAVLGGGLGWILVLFRSESWLGSLPLDFYSPESFGFLSIYGLPHLALARALLLWGMVIYLYPFDSEGKAPFDRIPGIGLGVLWFLLGFMQPLNVLVGWAVIITHCAFLGAWQTVLRFKGRPADWGTWNIYLRRLIWGIVISSPLVIYSFVASNIDPFFKAWTAQNRILSPHPFHYLIAYGLLFIYAVFGLRFSDYRKDWRIWLPALWIFILPLLVYAPYNLQRRLAEGVWVAMVVLAMVYIENSLRPYLTFRIFPLYLLFPTTFFLLLGGTISAIRPARPFFISTEEVRSFEYLASVIKPGAHVLTAYETGNVLPAWAPVQVVIGHGPESISMAKYVQEVEDFYQDGTSDAKRQVMIENLQLDFVYWGPAERKLGPWDPRQASYLHTIYDQGEYTLLETTVNIK